MHETISTYFKMTSKILLIEDNPADVEIIKEFLAEASFKHKFFHSMTFSGGINILSENEIDLVLLDLSLGDSIGFNTLKNFVKKAPNTPVVVMTGNNNEVVGIQSVKAGAQDFLVKGYFDSKRLVKTIRYSLQRFKTHVKLKQTAKQLSIIEKRTQEAHEMAKFANWEMDIVSNSMNWSDEMFRIFGFQPNTINPSLRDYLSYVYVEDKEKVESFFEEVIRTGKLNRIEHRILVKGRMVKYLTVQARVNYDEFTNKILLIGSIQDITDQKHDAQLVKGEEKPDKTAKIKEKALSELSFNIRTPLTSIINLLYLVEKTPTSQAQKELLDGLKTSVDDLSIVLNNLMNFSLLTSETIKLEQEEFHFESLIEDLEKVFRIKCDQAGVELRMDTDTNIPEKLIGDTQKISQIIYNLLVKALNYTNDDTQLLVSIGIKSQNKSEVQLKTTIVYQGISIPEDQAHPYDFSQEMMLENYSLSGELQGKGPIGLMIVSKLLNLMKGNILYEKVDGNHFGFYVEFPLKISKSQNKVIFDKPQLPLNLLFVEDHALNQIATKKVLTSWADTVSVDIAPNGLVALEKFHENSYDLILMDLQMPEMNGIEATIKIRHLSKIPIIALTATASKQEEEKCLAIGMNDYLAKPFKPKDLYAKILNLIAQEAKK